MSLTPLLSSLLKVERINLNLKAKKKLDALKELVAMIKTGEEAEQIVQRLVEREELGSTGIGRGIALPHSRSLLVNKLEIALGRSDKGVNFDALDKKPAHLFFLILAPPQDPGNQYLTVLGRLALLCQTLARNKAYMNPETPQQMLQLIRQTEEKLR